MNTLNIKDFFTTYNEFCDFMSIKIRSLKLEKKNLKRKVVRTLMNICEIKDPKVKRIVTRWYQLGEDYQQYILVKKEYKRLNNYVMLAKVQFQGKKLEDFQPLALEAAKEVKITEVLDEITERKTRDTYLCPLHKETSGSLKVYKNNSFYCFGCNVGGTTIDLVMKHYGLELPEAVKFLVGG